MASTNNSSYKSGTSFSRNVFACSSDKPCLTANSLNLVPNPNTSRSNASYSPSQRNPNSCSPCTQRGSGQSGPITLTSHTSASGRPAEYPQSRNLVYVVAPC